MGAHPDDGDMMLAFTILLVTTLVLVAASEWQPSTKGDAMKALFAAALAAVVGLLALSSYATPLPASAGLSAPTQAPLPADDDKDKDKDKDKKDG